MGIKKSDSRVYFTIMTETQKLFNLHSSYWYWIKGIFISHMAKQSKMIFDFLSNVIF